MKGVKTLCYYLVACRFSLAMVIHLLLVENNFYDNASSPTCVAASMRRQIISIALLFNLPCHRFHQMSVWQ